MLSSSLTSDEVFICVVELCFQSLNASRVTVTSSAKITCVCLHKRCASGIKSFSYNDLPTSFPAAATKVFEIPPPTTMVSAILDNESNTVNLVDTFEPPTIATNGRAGLSNALPNASSSLTSSGPAHAVGANLATP